MGLISADEYESARDGFERHMSSQRGLENAAADEFVREHAT